ncbi:MAG: S-methyl-5-thioribose-1-phosphate isomerase [Nitrososphaerota archaeon]|jgi:methylthioribose-1-phosphate isomerase|nr:S-methyl-5-thioribose-1-phosphate isomerase [Nitrososphaerota archaeon]MDG6928131.1 S-methyl-5-thioribose-1-phosphate isomerase [Nitrososphaerota archaeon]MDG6929692.1 S-methyl-5-thioribose-1-phosphate isomerase [Nitrososphaerota archaeon]MDG6932868.1 S-methyl-5-thioribose-1-phosphate isomerase [Nitrososphaerota archaeon]MDG6936283.1 S-methyl-5-thioribose-1-phosphate isomerase [Nitrososphaerota archaeon]
MRPIRVNGTTVEVLDQRLLPVREKWVRIGSSDDAYYAIKNMVVRGAPLIGVVAAFGLALTGPSKNLGEAARRLKSARPTAVNLAWAVDRVQKAAEGAGSSEAAFNEALRIFNEELESARKIGENGEKLFSDNDTVLTHCNAGALATVDYGTALAPVRVAREMGKNLKLYATETRPVMQGARLTSYELLKDGFDVTLIADTAVGYTMRCGRIDKVIVGADRVLRDGTTMNKIGTFQVATMAKRFSIPFYVALPSSTLDLKSGLDDVKIEERDPSELTQIRGRRTAPKGVKVFNPAFDITPPDLISAIITEKGVYYPPFDFAKVGP